MSSRRNKEEEYNEDEDDDFVPDDRDDEEEIDVSDNEDNEGIVMKKAAENTKKRAKKSAAASRPKKVRRGPFDSDDESEEEKKVEESSEDEEEDAPPAKRAKQGEEEDAKADVEPTPESSEADAFFASMMKGRPSAPKSNSNASSKLGVPASWLNSGSTNSPTSDSTDESDKTVPLDGPKKVVVKERYEFAGEQIEVERTVDEKEAANMQAKKSASGLGGLLDQLKGKNKISTLKKTKLDWNQYTEENGYEDEFVKNRKDGYIQKQEFLQSAEAAETAAYIAGRARARK